MVVLARQRAKGSMPARNILGETRNAGSPLMKQLKDADEGSFS